MHKLQCNLSCWQSHHDCDAKDCIHIKELVYHSWLSILVEAILNWLQSYYDSVEAQAYQNLADLAQALVLFSMGTLVCHTHLVSLQLQLHICTLFFFWKLCPQNPDCEYKPKI